MKIKSPLQRTLRSLSISVVVLMSGGCGVEAGNPDSKGGKTVRLYVSPTSYQDIGVVSANVGALNLTQGDEIISQSYQSKRLDLLTANSASSEEVSLALSVDVSDSQKELQKVEVVLAGDNPYLQITLASQAQPVKAAVVSESGELVRSLVFNGAVKSEAGLDIVIDVELRKTLKLVTAEQKAQLGLPEDVRYIIQQKHSFMNFAQSGSVGFTDYEPGSIVCVFVGDTLPTASSDACTGKGFKSQIISARGTATISAIEAGEYRVVNITRESKVVELKRATVAPGSKVVFSGK